ncbi:MAG: hypothetical protein H0X62_01385 [Bacteroidetes bacterium]|nr:hypothetical protein [Bacteroidota bacterium]
MDSYNEIGNEGANEINFTGSSTFFQINGIYTLFQNSIIIKNNYINLTITSGNTALGGIIIINGAANINLSNLLVCNNNILFQNTSLTSISARGIDLFNADFDSIHIFNNEIKSTLTSNFSSFYGIWSNTENNIFLSIHENSINNISNNGFWGIAFAFSDTVGANVYISKNLIHDIESFPNIHF